jgi:hypothetical protein
VAILRAQHTPKTARQLQSALQSLAVALDGITEPLPPHLTEYVLLPVMEILPRLHLFPDYVYAQIFVTLLAIQRVATVYLVQPQVFGQLFILSTVVLAKQPHDRQEHVKIPLLAFLRALIPASRVEGSTGTMELLKSDEFRGAVSHATVGLLDVVAKDTHTSVRLSALGCLEGLLVGCIDDADVVCNVFPGVVTCLTQCLSTGTESERVPVMVKACQVLGDVTCVVLSDVRNEAFRAKEQLLKDGQDWQAVMEQLALQNTDVEPVPQVDQVVPVIARSRTWLVEADQRLAAALQRHVLRLLSHDSWQVKEAAVRMARHVVLECARALPQASAVCVDMVVLATLDGMESTAQLATESLHKIQAIPHLKNLVQSMLSSKLCSLLDSLPRAIMSTHRTSREKSMYVNLTAAYLVQLQDQAASMITFLWPTMLPDCIDALQVDWQAVVEEVGIFSLDDWSTSDQQQKYFTQHVFTFLDTKELVLGMTRLFQFLGKHGDTLTLLDACVGLLQSNDVTMRANRGPIIWMVNELATGAMDKHEAGVMAESLLQEWTALDTLQYPSTRAEQLALLGDAHARLRLPYLTSDPKQCLLVTHTTVQTLRGISICAAILQQRFMEFEDALYTLLEKLGEQSNWHIQMSAAKALETVATACDYISPRAMLLAHMDQVVDAITFKLHNLAWHPKVLLVLTAVLAVAGDDILPHVQDMLALLLDMLEQQTTLQQEQRSILLVDRPAPSNIHLSLRESVLVVLQALCKLMLRHVPPSMDQAIEAQAAPDLVLAYIKDRQSTRLVEPSEQQETPEAFFAQYHADKQDSPEPLPEPDDTPTPTLPQMYAMDILRAMQHHINNHHAPSRSLALDIVSKATQILDTYQPLLALIHELWPSIPPRLQDKEPFVRTSALQTITTLCKVAREFMRSRMTKDVWPKVQRLLDNTPSDVDNDTSMQNMLLHALYVCQAMVQTAGVHVDVQWQVARSVSKWLKVHGHIPPWHRQAVKVLQHMPNQDVVWLVVTPLVTPTVLSSHPNLPDVQLPAYLATFQADTSLVQQLLR